MAYKMLTRTGRNFWEVTSIMQNSIRAGDYETAGYCMWEMIPQYIPYLKKRLPVISAEDCYGVVTKEILTLCKEGTEESLTKALSVLCRCKKNRDADYMVCNLFFSSEPLDMDQEELAVEMKGAIRAFDVVATGRIGSVLFKKKRSLFWKTLRDLAVEDYPWLVGEVDALHESNELNTHPSEETVFGCKAIVLMWTERDDQADYLGESTVWFDGDTPDEQIPIVKPLDECKKVSGNFPDKYYNWHTVHGKYELHRDAVHAISNDQMLLNPREENLFDECTWNRDLNFCLNKWNPKRYPLPYDDGKIRPEEKFKGRYEAGKGKFEQMTLFDYKG